MDGLRAVASDRVSALSAGGVSRLRITLAVSDGLFCNFLRVRLSVESIVSVYGFSKLKRIVPAACGELHTSGV